MTVLPDQRTASLVLDAVTRRYGRGDQQVVALREVSLSFRPTEFCAVMGPSGSGKSTLLHCAAGLDRPDAGRVLLEGTDLTRLGENRLARWRRERVGFVFQSFNLVAALTVEQNITLPLREPGWYAVAAVGEPGVPAEVLADRLDEAVGGPGVRVLHGADVAQAESRTVLTRQDLALAIAGGFGSFGVLFAGVVAAGPIALSVLQRRREIGLIRAVGATPGQARRMIIGEALVISTLGVAVGGPLGLLLAGPMRDVLIRIGMLPDWFALTRSPWAVLAGAVAAALAALGAAGLGVYRAGRVRPVEALRESTTPPRRVPLLRTACGGVLGIVLVVLSLYLFATGTATSALEALLAVGALLVAAFLLGPALVRLLRPLAFPGRWSRSPTSLLASSNVRLDPRRTAAVVMPVALIVAFTAALLAVNATAEREGRNQAAGRTTADVVLTAGGGAAGLPPAVATAAAEVPGVTAVAPAAATTVVVTFRPLGDVSGWAAETVDTRGLDPDRLPNTLELGVVSGTLDDLRRDTIAASTTAAARFGWDLGDRVPVTFGDGTGVELRVVALYERGLGFGDLAVPRDLAARHMSDPFDAEVFLAVDAGVGPEAVRDGLAGYGSVVEVQDRTSYLDSVESVSALDVQARYLLLGSLVVFAVAAAANAAVMSTMRRATELAGLRLIGLTRREVMRMVTREALASATIAVVIGLAIAGLVATSYSIGLSGSPVPAVPTAWWATTVAGAVALVVVASAAGTGAALRHRPTTASVD